jgi:hypothetical protein
MEPGLDSLREGRIEVPVNGQPSEETNHRKGLLVSPETVVETKKTPEAYRRLRANDAALEQLHYFQDHQKPIDSKLLKIKKFTHWMDVVVSDTNLLAKTIKAVNKTLDWLIETTREQDRLEKYWHNMKVAFYSYLAEIQQHHHH